jgi:hypothetical protein
MTTIMIDPAELTDAASVLQQSAGTLEGLAGQVYAACCCCVASSDVAGEVDAAALALQSALQSIAGGLAIDGADLALRGALIALDQALSSAAQTAWGAPAPATNGLYPTGAFVGGGGASSVVSISDHDALYPSVAIIGGGGGVPTFSDHDALYPATAFVGGNGGYDITILGADGQAVDPSTLMGPGIIGGGGRGGVMGSIMDLGDIIIRKQEDLQARANAMSSAGVPGAAALSGRISTTMSNVINSTGISRLPGESDTDFAWRSGQSTGPNGDVPILG